MFPLLLHSLLLHMLLTADGDAVVARKPLVATGADERFPALVKELLEADRARAELLFFGEWDILCDEGHLLILSFISCCVFKRGVVYST